MEAAWFLPTQQRWDHRLGWQDSHQLQQRPSSLRIRPRFSGCGSSGSSSSQILTGSPASRPYTHHVYNVMQRRRPLASAAAAASFSSVALAWFNNVRVPAALLATAAMRMLFISEGKVGGRLQNALRSFYMLMMCGTVVAELSIVFVATLATAKVLTADIPPATTAMMCLMTSFELEYLTCRALMLLGAIALLWGLAARTLLVWSEVNASKPTSEAERLSLLAASITMFAVPLAFIGYSDANAPTLLSAKIPGLQNYASIVRRASALLFRHLLLSRWGCAAMLLFLTSFACVCAACLDIFKRARHGWRPST
mmetsp:Transcript_21888/g.51129  ORF Transcript_21888/g.51129 Transcript_21888/m.51129 type:complete len:311 (+) Transcript_21888:124-1056(+)